MTILPCLHNLDNEISSSSLNLNNTEEQTEQSTIEHPKSPLNEMKVDQIENLLLEHHEKLNKYYKKTDEDLKSLESDEMNNEKQKAEEITDAAKNRNDENLISDDNNNESIIDDESQRLVIQVLWLCNFVYEDVSIRIVIVMTIDIIVILITIVIIIIFITVAIVLILFLSY